MNDETYPDSFDELRGDLRVAVEYVKRRPIPQATMDEALDRALHCGSPGRWTAHWSRRKALVGLAGAVAACLAIGFWLLRPSDSWADVVKAVGAKPWIHGTIHGAAADQSPEFWISTSRSVGGLRSQEEISFFDERLQIVDRYKPAEKVLYRLPISSTQDLAQSQELLDVFGQLFRGEAKLKTGFSGMALKDQKRRRVEKDGQKWDEYELHFQILSQSNSDMGMTFTVDAQTHLPHSMTMQGDGGKSVEWTFDYPENGPADIYALGVPKDAKLIDRMPTGDMSRILAAIQAGRDRFDDFQALVIRNEWPDLFPTAGKPIPMAFLVWKKGNRWRIETALPPQEYFGNHFPVDKDHKQWLRDLFKKALFEPLAVCDGKVVYEGEMEGQKRGTFKLLGTADQADSECPEVMGAMPATWCYPRDFNAPNDRTEEILNLKPAGGPPNTVLVTSRVVHPRDDEIPWQRFWLDSARGYVVVRHDLLTADPAKPPTDHDIQDLMDQWEQTPSGIWYPTRVNVGSRGGEWYHFFLDFKADMPDDLFKPTKRTVLTEQYPVGS